MKHEPSNTKTDIHTGKGSAAASAAAAPAAPSFETMEVENSKAQWHAETIFRDAVAQGLDAEECRQSSAKAFMEHFSSQEHADTAFAKNGWIKDPRDGKWKHPSQQRIERPAQSSFSDNASVDLTGADGDTQTPDGSGGTEDAAPQLQIQVASATTDMMVSTVSTEATLAAATSAVTDVTDTETHTAATSADTHAPAPPAPPHSTDAHTEDTEAPSATSAMETAAEPQTAVREATTDDVPAASTTALEADAQGTREQMATTDDVPTVETLLSRITEYVHDREEKVFDVLKLIEADPKFAAFWQTQEKLYDGEAFGNPEGDPLEEIKEWCRFYVQSSDLSSFQAWWSFATGSTAPIAAVPQTNEHNVEDAVAVAQQGTPTCLSAEACQAGDGTLEHASEATDVPSEPPVAESAAMGSPDQQTQLKHLFAWAEPAIKLALTIAAVNSGDMRTAVMALSISTSFTGIDTPATALLMLVSGLYSLCGVHIPNPRYLFAIEKNDECRQEHTMAFGNIRQFLVCFQVRGAPGEGQVHTPSPHPLYPPKDPQNLWKTLIKPFLKAP